MIPASLIAERRRIMGDIETLANRDLLAVWRTIDLDDARAATAALIGPVRDLTAAYGDMAAVAAADFYDESRAASRAPGTFRSQAAGVVPVEQSDVLVRWALTPLWATDPRYGAALSRLAGGQQRLIRRAERDTMFESGRRDPALATWVRVPRNDACEFCLMLASRGDVYETRETATQVGPRPRGTRAAGETFHDNCRCDVVATWSPDDVPDINRRLQAEWDEHASGASNPRQAWREHIAATRNT